jgi:single stranded DNA-binding protein
MGSVNKITLVGNLGRDGELRYLPTGTALMTLNLATTDVFKDKEGQNQEKTEWHRIVVWGKTAESLAEYLTKGKQIYVEGRIQTRPWTDENSRRQLKDAVLRELQVDLSDPGRAERVRAAIDRALETVPNLLKRQSVEVRADRIVLLSSGGGARGAGTRTERESGDHPETSRETVEPLTDDDIPF